MSSPPTTRRKLLVIGATGKQGRALIQALVSPPPPVQVPAVTTADKDTKAIVITTSEADSRGGTPSSFTQQHQQQEVQGPIIAWDILAVSRNPASTRAKSLLQLLPSPTTTPESDLSSQPRHTITLVQGDLDNPSSIRVIFEQHNGNSTSSTTSKSEHEPEGSAGQTKIWGVFLVLMYPGVSKKPDEQNQNQKQGQSQSSKPNLKQHIELRQGKLMTDLAHEYGVEAFIYSSSLPAPLDEMSEDERNPADGDKLANERYMKSLGSPEGEGGGGAGAGLSTDGVQVAEGKRPLNWIIVRPGFFMENLEGFLGSITVTVFREGLSEDATLPLVASKDIGQVVAGIFRDHTRYLHKTLAISSGLVTMREVMAAHQRATGKPISAIPNAVGKLLIKMNAGTRRVLKLYQLSHEARLRGTYYPEFESECALAKTVCHLHSYEEWKRSETEPTGGVGAAASARVSSVSEIERPGTAGAAAGSGSGIGFEAGWNQVSIWKLVTGRS